MIYAFVDKRIPEGALATLSELGFCPVLIEPVGSLLGLAVESHTDLALFSHGGTAIAPREYLTENPKIRDAVYSAFPTVIESDYTPGRNYPFDAIYNALVIGECLFARVESVCPDILAYAKREGLRVVNVRQGYPACLTLKVDNAAITSDEGLYRAFTSEGIRALLIGNSEIIKLAPYPYGFIGGASGAFGNTVYFIGELSSHPEYGRIRDFIESEGYSLASLMPSSGELFDLGGIAFSPDISTAPTMGKSTIPKNPKSE